MVKRCLSWPAYINKMHLIDVLACKTELFEHKKSGPEKSEPLTKLSNSRRSITIELPRIIQLFVTQV